ncbi:MAG: hypothetical protein QOI06_729, partial [Nocardioidaceae bacterium]|nr:hypothetical protein [Nocardioidaceae bacterium]
LVGRNGAGKTTALTTLAGERQAHAGTVEVTGEIGYLPQDPRSGDLDISASDRVLSGRGLDVLRSQMVKAQIAMAEPADDAERDRAVRAYGRLEDQFAALGGYAAESEAARICANLGLADRILVQTLGTLSGGQRRRVELARILFSDAETLLLDEPTNHLDAESVQWLESHLKAYPGAVLAVTHDRYFLDNVASWILELDRGRAHPYEGNYSTYLETKEARLVVEGRKDAKRLRMLERELEWVRSNPRARQAKSKSRLSRYEELASEAERNRKVDLTEINIPAGPRLGDVVLEANGLTKGFGDEPLMRDLGFTLPRAGIVGVIGPNGVGKTTLFRMIVGEETPDAGELRIGNTVRISYVDQSRGGLDPKKNVWEIVSDGLDHIKVANFEMPSRAYIASFGFKGPDQQKRAAVLSGGERNRLNLALTLKMGGNLLLLDEPTNDLDVETLQSLEDALLDFPGCALITSHDRWFLDRIATHILAWEGNDEDPASWFWFEGNYESYEANKIERLGAEAARPHRVTHRRLTRD